MSQLEPAGVPAPEEVPSPSGAPSGEESKLMDRRKPRALVVDDDAHIRGIVTRVLEGQAGMVTVAAADGQEALEALRAPDARFEVLITDMHMPRMNGAELLKVVKQERPDLPAIVMTAYKEDRNVVDCLELGAVEYLAKPVKMDELIHIARRAVQWRLSQKDVENRLAVTRVVQGWVEITAPSHFEFVDRFQRFTALLGDLPLKEKDREDIRIAVDELGQNAVEWGNRNDPDKMIRLSYCVFKDRIVFKIEDEGAGFDHGTLRDPSVDPLAHLMARMDEGKRPGGYGVFLTRKLMDDVLYNESGNTVLLTKNFKRSVNLEHTDGQAS